MFQFCAPQEVERLMSEGERVVDVSSRAPLPYSYLSPFYPHGNIPVPGMPEVFSDSVEGVWQGLKISRGEINPGFFKGKGRKRRCRVMGHKYNGEILNYPTARNLIYVPAYRWMVFYCPLAQKTAVELMWTGTKEEIFLYDVCSNGDINNLSKPLAHASVLADILNENLRIFRRYTEDAGFRQVYDADHNGEPAHKIADLMIEEVRKAN